LSSENYESAAYIDGKPAGGILIYQYADANALAIIHTVREQMDHLKATFPEGLDYTIVYNTTDYVDENIKEVQHTLVESFILVMIVVFVFLQGFRATIIPMLAIPVSLVATFAVMAAFGFSINSLTLCGLVLAIGLVVDDAIVVVENIHRHIEEGKTPLEAAIEGAREIAMPVISMTITLAAVYAPIGFLTGLTGALFKEFALTLAGAVVISGIVALTLSPMMCALLLRHDENPSGLAHRLDLIFEGLKRRYRSLLHGTLNTRPVVLVFAVIVLCLIPVLLKFTKSELAPDEDQGIIFMLANAPQPTNLDYVSTYTDEFVTIFKAFPEYYSSFQINGFNGVQSGVGGFLLKPWNERHRTQMQILPQVQAKLASIPGLQIFGFNLPSLPGTGQGLPFQFVINSANDYESLLEVTDRVKKRALATGKFAFADVDLAFDKPEVVVDIDRAKAAQMGVSMQELGGTLATLLGEAEINRFTIEGRSYKVIAQVERPFRSTPDWLNNYYVRNTQGELLALSTLITVTDRARPRQLNQFQQLNSAILSGVPLVSMGEAIDTVRQIAREEAPAGYAFDYAGASRQYVQEGSALWVTFGLALAIIFLVLAAQFESFRDPLVILVTVPLSICGALIPLFLGWSSMNIYTQVGLVTLIGLISKHGILIVQFANQLRKDKGLTPREAVEEAAAIRLRPVLMTTAAMVFGMVPLIIATGAGAVSRFDIGTVIATGMSIGTLFTLFVLPCVYTLLAKPDKPKEHT
jgi:multidrug efflux pump